MAALEQPARWAGLVDLPTDLEPWTAMRLGGILTGGGVEDQLAVRESGVLVRRLVPATTTDGELTPWQPRGTVLITGLRRGAAA
ncbi:hypothetical protein DLJ57_25595 [Micromonospora chalcea]|nr:hypothetical protein DLJ57_25595 [Micromonospora chalcea]